MERLRLLAFALLAVSGTPAIAQQPLSLMPTLHTPDVIAPAVLPYLACLYAERGLPLLRATDGSQVAYAKSGSDCSAARTRAGEEAAKLMQGKPAPGGLSAAAFIDQTLADMDAYVASLPMTESASAQSAVVGIPVTIEDEVQPAYDRYDDCLKTQASNAPVTSHTIEAKFREAMTSCAGVRSFAVAEASKALSAKGWDETTRAQAAESTFAKVDQSWLAMGQQYEAVLRAREATARSTATAAKGPAKAKSKHH